MIQFLIIHLFILAGVVEFRNIFLSFSIEIKKYKKSVINFLVNSQIHFIPSVAGSWELACQQLYSQPSLGSFARADKFRPIQFVYSLPGHECPARFTRCSHLYSDSHSRSVLHRVRTCLRRVIML